MTKGEKTALGFEIAISAFCVIAFLVYSYIVYGIADIALRPTEGEEAAGAALGLIILLPYALIVGGVGVALEVPCIAIPAANLRGTRRGMFKTFMFCHIGLAFTYIAIFVGLLIALNA